MATTKKLPANMPKDLADKIGKPPKGGSKSKPAKKGKSGKFVKGS